MLYGITGRLLPRRLLCSSRVAGLISEVLFALCACYAVICTSILLSVPGSALVVALRWVLLLTLLSILLVCTAVFLAAT